MDSSTPIAVIGMSCRFGGGVDSPERLWQLCADGRTVWSEIPSSRFNIDGVYHPNFEKLNTTNVKGGHFLTEDVSLFDAAFFNLSAEAAASLDPQFRLQLETTYEALESAGLTLQGIAGSNTSVFAGAFFRDYHEGHLRDPETLPRFLLMGTGAAMASNRLSHFYDLRGPSMSIDTGCSTTLTALHQACLSLRARESDLSIVGGANVMLNPDMFVAMSSLTLVSPDGKSYTFDSRANGYGRGEGSATLILKRLQDAIRDGDPIRAVIRETGVNQDGKTETITTPSEGAQRALIQACYRRAGLDPAQTAYFEAHGTGTPTGDPIEARAIASVFQNGRAPDQPLRLGSVKANIGHTETASGAAAVIKVALALEKGQIPPAANFRRPNPKLRLDEWNLKVPLELESWPRAGETDIRRASINNFGYGGSNAHVIMESYRSFQSSSGQYYMNGNGASNGGVMLDSVATNGVITKNGTSVDHAHTHAKKGPLPKVIVLSAKDEQVAQAMVTNLKDYLLSTTTTTIEDENYETSFLDNLAYTLGQRRTRFPWVSAVACDSNVADLVAQLESPAAKPTRGADSPPRIGFVFTGQGAQWHAMGRELIDAYPVFKAALLEMDAQLKEVGIEWNLIDELKRDAATTRVNKLEFSSALTVALQVALVRLLESWGVVPAAVTSHSSGEMAAAYAVGALGMKSLMTIVAGRGQLAADAVRYVSSQQQGGMLAVGLGVEASQAYLARVTEGRVVVACENSPTSTTISGDVAGLDQLEAALKQDNVFARRLKVEAAWHSHHMQPVAGPYLEWMSKSLIAPDSDSDSETGRTHTKPTKPKVVYSSPSTGQRMHSCAEIASPSHWVNSLTQPVRFVDAFRNMCFDRSGAGSPEVDMVVEVGPHAALSGPIQDIMTLPQFSDTAIKYSTCLVRNRSALETMHALACDLLRVGYPVNMAAVNFPGQHGGSSSSSYGLEVLPNLPRYPWNHQARHWSEPRANRALRARAEMPHDLLGALVPGTNPSAPVWRHIIRAKDLPWVRDHVVQSNIVYPGAGFIAMAIEGAAWQASHMRGGDGKALQEAVQGYRLRDVDILHALIVPETSDGVEVQLTLRPCGDKAIYAKGWSEFQVQSVTADNKWIEHCKGLVLVQFAGGSSASDENAKWATATAGGGWEQDHRLANSPRASEYRLHIDPADIYSCMRSVGIFHGPVFQNLRSIRARPDGQSTTTFDVADTAAVMPSQHQHEHVVHPTTLDSVFQAAYTALPGAGTEMPTAMVPRSIRDLWVARNISAEAGHRLRACADVGYVDAQSFTSAVAVVDDDSGRTTTSDGPDRAGSSILIAIEGFVCQSLGNARVQPTTEDPKDKRKFAVGRWAPDITFITADYLRRHLSSPVDPAEIAAIMSLRRLCLHYVYNALAALTTADVQRLSRHHKKFYIWMKQQAELARQNALAPDSSTWLQDGPVERAALAEAAAAGSVNGEMVCRLGPHIVQILRGELTALELMLEDRLLYRYYVGCLKWARSSQQMAELVRHFTHKKPRARIIEIGAGTGGTTTHVLNAIGKDGSPGGPRAASYEFTDVSSGFFEAAKDLLADWKSLVRYKKLDIEQDPAEQGFEQGTYDLVIACQVLHATRSMDNTIANVRKLLKPDGQLFILETTQDQLDLQFAFGLLPGWWLSEEKERRSSPSLSPDMWDRVLRRNGFRGVEAEVRDCESDEFYSFSVIASTVVANRVPAYDFDIVFVVATGSTPPPSAWLEKLRVSVGVLTGSVPIVQTLESVHVDDNTVCVLLDVEDAVLARLNAAQFDGVKAICTQSKGLLWVTRGGAVECGNPQSGLAAGFLRSLREEYVGKRVGTLDLDPAQALWCDEAISAVTGVFDKLFDYPADHLQDDYEFAHRDGVIQTLRYSKDVDQVRDKTGIISDAAADQSDAAPAPTPEPFLQPERPLRLSIQTAGLLDTLAFDDDPDAASDLPHDFIEVEPRAFGVNFRDIMVAMGQLKHRVLGFECAGVVRWAGPSAAAQGYQPGDRVTMLLRGHYSSRARVHWTSAVHMPDDMDFETAASLPTIYATVYVSLIDTARLQRGETVLIHSATGGIGQAAVMLAQHLGAEIFVTVGSDEKRRLVMDQYGIPADHIFFSRDASFAAGIRAATAGRGVDVVLNSLAGNLLQESVNCLAPFGRFIELGKRDLEQNHCLALEAFTRAVSFSSIDLIAFGEHKGLEANRILKGVMRLLGEKAIRPVHPVTAFPISDAEKAFRLMQTGKHMGKIVLSVDPDVRVPVLPAKPEPVRLRSDAAYLIVGGFGGIGRSVCRWMAERGAKHLIVVSRSAGSEAKISELLAEMEYAGARGVDVKAIGCDVADANSLGEALQECAGVMPPIRGVVHGGMVLEDSILEQMTLSRYTAAVGPKLQGSWNLHSYFNEQRTQDLDFFIMLSSQAGILGWASQCNYSAGGSFQDALSEHRVRAGLPGVSIDLSIVKGIGYLAGDGDGTAKSIDKLSRHGHVMLSEADVLAGVSFAVASPFAGQLLLGLYSGQTPPHDDSPLRRDLRFAALRPREEAADGQCGAVAAAAAAASDLGAQIAAATAFTEAVAAVLRGLVRKLMDVFMIAEDEVSPAKAPTDFGIDSLVAVELRNMFALRAGAEMSIFDIMQSPSLNALAAAVAAKSRFCDPVLVPS